MVKNTADRYGFVTKALHWAVFLLIVNQFVVAWMMLHTSEDQTRAGFTQGTLYNWHKSVGLVTFALVVLRFVWRKTTELPDWAPNLSVAEKRAIEILERTLYACMFLMPASGFVFVMAGGYGVDFFGRWALPNVIGEHPTVAFVAEWAHYIVTGLLVMTLVGHWGLVFRHQRIHRDRYLQRMLPFTHQK